MSIELYMGSRIERNRIYRVLKMIEILKERKCIDRIELAKMLNVTFSTIENYRRLARMLFKIETYKHDLKICIEF